MTAVKVLLAAIVAVAVAGCGGGAASTTSSPIASSSPTPSPTLAASATPSGQSVSAAQSIAVAKAIFPMASAGGYLECDNGASDIASCPFSARLKAEIARYASNYKTQCPSGCGGALLVIRDQCGPFPDEQVTTAQNPAVAVVALTGDTTCRGVNKTFYVSVIMENGIPVADDIDCNVADRQYGMYNSNPNATLPPTCPST